MFLGALDWMALDTIDNSACLFNFSVIKHCICILYCCTHGPAGLLYFENKTIKVMQQILSQ